VSPGTVSVEGTAQTSGNTAQDFSQPVYYKVVSKDGSYTRTYRVTVEFVNEADSRPRIQNFIFMTEDNGGLGAASSGMIDHDAGLIVIEAVYTNDPPPYNLVPRFSAGGTVSVSGLSQTSGTSAQDFSHKVKYTVKDPGNPTLARDYWVEARFVRESASLAEISEFRFFAADNPGLVADVTAVIDQGAGTIYAVLPFNSVGNGHRTLYPRWLAQGTVRLGGAVQQSGTSGAVFSPQVVYRVVSADGTFYRDYTVKVLEINTRIYVNRAAAGDNTGVSWANAFRSLADACDAADRLPAALAAELWIAEGTYRPSETRDKAAYFKVSPNTGYYGGFAGTETAKEQRVPADHPVTITGELGGGVLSANLFMNADMGNTNAAFGELRFTKAEALTGIFTRGPAITVDVINNLTITNSVFEDMKAENFGGAVYAVSSGSVNISGCKFENTSSGGSGGALNITADNSGSMAITNCTFEYISAYSGGAVYAYSYSSSSVIISNCIFEYITSGNYGGAVYAFSSAGSITISDCNFEHTSSSYFGGAVYAYSNTSSMSISNCTFEYISAYSGGAVYAYSSSSSSVNISGCNFENTQATTSDGGAVYASSSSGSITISDCNFEHTSSLYFGGAVYAASTYGGSSSVIITDCDFSNTSSTNPGGAVLASTSSGSITISGGTFANTSSESNGGAVYAYSSSGGSITINGGTFTNTSSGNYGGAVDAYSPSGSITINGNCKFENAQAGGSDKTGYIFGGSLYLNGNTVEVTDVEITKSTVSSSSGARGGGIYINQGTAALSRVSFTDVKALGNATETIGGALFFNTGTALTMTDCSINGAVSEKGGAIGGISASSCTLNRVAFSNCAAPQGSLLYGNTVSGTVGAPAYTVKSGCKVNGTEITLVNWSSFLPLVALLNGATIMAAP
jgi:hypothetical protein